MPIKSHRRLSWKAKISRCLRRGCPCPGIASSSRDDFASCRDLDLDDGDRSPFFRRTPLKLPSKEDDDSSPIIFLTLEERMIARGFIPRFRDMASSGSTENEETFSHEDVYGEQDVWESVHEPHGPPPPLP